MSTVDLTKLTDQQIKDELAKRAKAKVSKKEEYKNLIPDVLPDVFAKLHELSDFISQVKAETYADLKALVQLKFDAYDTKSDQQSHTFSDKNCSITIGYNVNAGYDDTVYMGIAKVREFIKAQVKDEETAKLVNQINRLLKINKDGNLDPKRIMELRQMANEYNDISLIEGVQIIEDAYHPKRSSWFIKASHKNAVGIEVNLPLSIASADFPKDFDLTYLLPEENN